MFKYLMKRTGLMLLTFVITVFLVFVVIKALPDNYVAPPLTGNDWYEKMKEAEGWDKHVVIQFWYWVRNIFRRKLWILFNSKRDVSSVFFGKVPAIY